MKFRKLLFIELTSILLGIIVVLYVIQGSSFLFPIKNETNIGLLQQRDFANGTLSIMKGQQNSISFNYSSFNPPIMLLDIKKGDLLTAGYLTISCNGRFVANVLLNNERTESNIVIVSSSGPDWIKPRIINTIDYQNVYQINSDSDFGYEGTVSFNLSMRGSR